MARVRCRYEDCVFLDEGYCTAALIEVDPDQGCLTYRPIEDVLDEEWDEALEDEELLDEDEDLLDEDEDLWDEEDEEI